MGTSITKTLLGLTLAVTLLLLIKASALVSYWQQSRHIFLHTDARALSIPTPEFLSAFTAPINSVAATSNTITARMTFAGQYLLVGEAALPQVIAAPVNEVPALPETITLVADCAPSAMPANSPLTTVQENPQVPVPVPGPSNENFSGANDQPINNARAIDSVATTSANASTAEKIPSEDATTNSTKASNTYTDKIQTTEPLALSLLPSDKLLLIGDSMMQGVAPHIVSKLRRKYGITSVDLSRQSTGLSFPGFFDWPAQVEASLAETDYKALVVFLGANDTWDIVLKGHALKFGTEPWREVYNQRVETILSTAEAKGVAILWLGAPPMEREDLRLRVPVLNEIYRAAAERHKAIARFIDTGKTLTADGVTFTKFLELPERGSIMVRANDGIHFTSNGQRLLAELTLAQFTLPDSTHVLSRNP